MYVEEFSGLKGAKIFRYKIRDREYEETAGTVVCELLNSGIFNLLNDYQCYLHSGKEEYRKRVEKTYTGFSQALQDILKDIFPINSHNVYVLEEIADLITMISHKIDSNDANYNFFLFAMTNFYEYKPPVFPIQKYKVSFLSFICPLIENYIPFNIYIDDYRKLIEEINEINNILYLETLLIRLEKLIEKENIEKNNIRRSIHCKHIRDIIIWYCMDEVQKYNYLPYDLEDDDLELIENKYDKLYLEQLEALNANTDLIMIQRICEENSISYKSFFIDLLYSYNNFDKEKRTTYYLRNAKELICHAILYCFKDNQLPIKQCKYCKKYYTRIQNSQTVCSSCKGLTGPMTDKEQKEVFGEKIEVLLNSVYRKLCYRNKDGKSTLRYDKYTKDGLLTVQQSNILVKRFVKLISEYKKMGYEYIKKYKSLVDPLVQKDYANFVKEWMRRIDEYYTSRNIRDLIEQALEKDFDKPIVIIKEFSLNVIQVEETERNILLYKQD